MSAIADLVVNFSANSAALTRTLKSVEGQLHHFEGQVQKMRATLMHAFEITGTLYVADKLKEFVETGINSANAMGRMAEKAGVSVEEMSKFNYAMNMSEVETDSFSKAMVILAKNLTAAAAGNKQMQNVFKALKVDVKDGEGNVRKTTDALLDMADGFRSIGDKTAALALIRTALGRGGADMVPALAQGKKGIQDLMAEAERLGVVITGDTLVGTQQLEQALKRLKAMSNQLAIEVARRLAPSLTDAGEAAAQFAADTAAIKEIADDMVNLFKLWATAGIYLWTMFKGIGTAIGEVAAIVVAAVSRNWAGVKAIMDQSDKDLEAILLRAYALQQRLWNPPKPKAPQHEYHPNESDFDLGSLDQTAINKQEAAVKKLKDVLADLRKDQAEALGATPSQIMALRFASGDLADVVKEAGKAGPAYKKAILDMVLANEQLQKAVKPDAAVEALRNLEQELATFGKDDMAVWQYRVDFGDLSKSIAATGPVALKYREDILAAAQAVYLLKLQHKNANETMEVFRQRVEAVTSAYEETRTPQEEFADRLKKLNELFDQGRFMPEVYARAVKKAALEMVRSDKVLSEIAPALTGAFRSMVDAARNGEDMIEAVWNSMLNSFLNVLDKMLQEWIETQIAMALVAQATGGGGAVGLLTTGAAGMANGGQGIQLTPEGNLPDYTNPFNTVSGAALVYEPAMPTLATQAPPGLSAAALQAAAVPTGATEVHLHIGPNLDAASFSGFLERNERSLASAIARLAYKRRI